MIPIVLDQHAEEAGFLAGLRDYAVRAPYGHGGTVHTP
jgi:hypothetical protein